MKMKIKVLSESKNVMCHGQMKMKILSESENVMCHGQMKMKVLDENEYPVDLASVFSFFKEQGDSIVV